MRTFKPRAFSISDFYSWYKEKQLILNPDFQRREVWSSQSKSNLVNTILLGLPLPIFFIRNKMDPETKRATREVVDGQQRLRAIFDFIDNGFPVKKSQNDDYGGKLFSELPSEVQSEFLEYELSVNALVDLSDNDVLDIFARLNSYGVRLNKQELLNAKYFGYFKQLAYSLGFRYKKFWSDNGIFSHANIIRMKEVEFVSDTLMSMLDGIHDLKALEKCYKLYDETFVERITMEKRFCEIIDAIGNMFSGELKISEFSKSPMLSSLFTTLYHMRYGIKGLAVSRKEFSEHDYPRIRSALNEIEELFSKEDLSPKEHKFIAACKSTTSSKLNKEIRCKFISEMIYKYV
jgi:hypothetical protein